MKIILSRKGFDSANGRCPSPILPDGTMLSMPIPNNTAPCEYRSLTHNNKTYYDIWHELCPKRKNLDEYCHLDPDIRKNIWNENDEINGRVPAFGQVDAAETHLENDAHCVKIGDIFIFFGWFKETEFRHNGSYKYKKGAPDLHAMYGYLQIGEILKGNDIKNLKWHPHSNEPFIDAENNTIYVASNKLSFGTETTGFPGSGVFKFNNNLVLTKNSLSRSKWELPAFFKNVDISYHNADSFINQDSLEYFQSAKIGQEFVISESDDITNWAHNIIFNNFSE